MQPLPITVILAVKNEAANLPKCLAALKGVERVVVIDSQSTDNTPDIIRQHGAELVQFHFTGTHPKKRQWAIETIDIVTPWVMLLDADEVVPDALWNEINAAISPGADAPRSQVDAFLITKGFHFLGKKLTFGGFSFQAVLLFRTGKARFEKILAEADSGFDMEVHERLIVDGTIGTLKTPLIHEDFKSLHAYLDRHNRYSTWEAQVRTQFLKTGQWGEKTVKPKLFGNSQERRRWLKYVALRMPFEPTLWFVYHYFFKLGFLEGRPGWIASRIRAQYIFQVRAKMYEIRKVTSRSA
ncbi:MAG TPA: glycosyltransferase family 2 protein [Gemmatales bacterium]|nr:glycosyltransferase family 2 protein [Gemmatales bacterium]